MPHHCCRIILPNGYCKHCRLKNTTNKWFISGNCESGCSVRELSTKMQILKIFGAVIYLNFVSSMRHNRLENGHKVIVSASVNMPGSDYTHITKVHGKRYTNFAQKSLMRDLLNSYFKIGSVPRSDLIVSSPERSPDALGKESPKLSSIQPTTMTKKAKKVQPELKDRSHLMPFEVQTNRPIYLMENIDPISVEIEPKLVKRPIIVVGRVRMGASGRASGNTRAIATNTDDSETFLITPEMRLL